ncbi:MAG: SoxR reducing system RseC family protein [Melioribacteraceae bacterium]|nr:SoxR reducing system RseC family protein [Melioribacteraceae bacterium]MCF8354830.1 SoxR reducing system RseC family protein [Melioribacteraceae bacterium]MCF8394539.1 SoxR reducing system RseC family protein [Melioribacteraceae bacterium]MCF8420198.1 SoxR reducing system RseC family protein [Melioribacteraceae bacterium]
MAAEELFEEGIVVESTNGEAKVALLKGDSCEHCSAKLYCKPQSENTNLLNVTDPFGVNPGDEVKISVSGSDVLKAAFVLYGMPLILLVAGLFIGLSFFKNSSMPELYAFFTGTAFLIIYFFLTYFLPLKLKSKAVLPKIIFVKRKG